MKWINANALCLVCGTTDEHPKTGFCKNDHDNWLEDGDDMKRFVEDSVIFSTDIGTINETIATNSNKLEL